MAPSITTDANYLACKCRTLENSLEREFSRGFNRVCKRAFEDNSRDNSINRSINRSINPSIDQSIDQSIHQSINQSINRAINRSIDQARSFRCGCAVLCCAVACTLCFFSVVDNERESLTTARGWCMSCHHLGQHGCGAEKNLEVA